MAKLALPRATARTFGILLGFVFREGRRQSCVLSLEFLDLGTQLRILCPQLLILGNQLPNQFEQLLCVQLCGIDLHCGVQYRINQRFWQVRAANQLLVFYQLRLWQDKNHNGISEAVELHTLSELGVETIRLDYQQWGWIDQYGNLFEYRAKVQDSLGAQIGRWAFDVFLRSAV